MNLPCKTCLVVSGCRHHVRSLSPYYNASNKIVATLLSTKSTDSLRCQMLRDYCEAYVNKNPNIWVNIHKIATFFNIDINEDLDEINITLF